jgi:hypothetical protein
MKRKKQQRQDSSQSERHDAAKSKPQPATGTPKAALASPETLAIIAATLAKGGVEKPETFIANAAAFYDAACAHLESKASYLEAKQAKAEARAALPRHQKFPATFNDILKLIVRAKTPADGTKRFRDYLRDDLTRYYAPGIPPGPFPSWVPVGARKRLDEMKSKNAAKQLAKAIDEQVAHGIQNHTLGIIEETWFWLVKDYHDWWDGRLRDQRRAAGKKSKKSS